jgi:hypothetical protein
MSKKSYQWIIACETNRKEGKQATKQIPKVAIPKETDLDDAQTTGQNTPDLFGGTIKLQS